MKTLRHIKDRIWVEWLIWSSVIEVIGKEIIKMIELTLIAGLAIVILFISIERR